MPKSCKSLITMNYLMCISPADQAGIGCGVLRVSIIALGIPHDPSCETIVDL